MCPGRGTTLRKRLEKAQRKKEDYKSQNPTDDKLLQTSFCVFRSQKFVGIMGFMGFFPTVASEIQTLDFLTFHHQSNQRLGLGRWKRKSFVIAGKSSLF